MFVVETVARIRRAHFVQGKSIKLICRELRVSRKVVRKVLRSAATEFHYEREQQPRPRLGAWRERLDELLVANEAKASRETEFAAVDVKAIRARQGKSQAEFARMIGVSVATLRNWEQGRRRPEGPARALLKVAAANPEAVAAALAS